MMLAHPDWDHILQWDSCHPASLILENPKDYMAIVADLSEQIGGGEGQAVFSENDQILSMEKDVLLVRDMWADDANHHKKLINGMYRKLVQLAQDDYEVEMHSVLRQVNDFLAKTVQDSHLPLNWEEPLDIAPLLKAFGVTIEHSDNVLERLLDIARLSQEFLKIRLLIVVGIRQFLTPQELREFCRDYSTAGLPLLLIDTICGSMIPNERRLIIDMDRCELLLP